MSMFGSLAKKHVPLDPSERSVRVFVSSTFADLIEERKHLMEEVFPRIEAFCREHDVSFDVVDLRWGITSEQQAEGRVLPICLDAIDRCRPFFIGLLGDRYGWVPDDLPAELIARHPWLEAERGRSITEIEMAHGVLRDPSRSGTALFYARGSASGMSPDPRLTAL